MWPPFGHFILTTGSEPNLVTFLWVVKCLLYLSLQENQSSKKDPHIPQVKV